MTVSLDIGILIVDDFVTMRRIIRNALKGLGFNNIEEAADGAEALDKLRAGRFDLVITDWNMPNMNGLDLLKSIRADQNLRGTPVLMVTAEAVKENVVQAVKAGVSNYVVKPFAPEVMREKIEAIFR